MQYQKNIPAKFDKKKVTNLQQHRT